MMGTWLQSEQADKDLAQARREKFFGTGRYSTTGGAVMEPIR
ncbi:conjugal transfer protein TrbJ, partial [Mesorhizobium sp. M2A.F.Ca.ET.037.01.1.1]